MSAKTTKAVSSRIKYSDEPIEAKVIRDFLPPPEALAFREEGVKVTIALSRKSVEFFKSEAEKHHTQYQRMIRKLIDSYVDTYTEPLTPRSTRTARKRAAG
jgi:predicted DNA binding CopG/RHH family protein